MTGFEDLITRIRAAGAGDFRKCFTAPLADGTRKTIWGDVVSAEDFARVVGRLTPQPSEQQKANFRALRAAGRHN